MSTYMLVKVGDTGSAIDGKLIKEVEKLTNSTVKIIEGKVELKDAVSASGHPVEVEYPEMTGSIRNFFNECYSLFLSKQHDRKPDGIAEFGAKGIVPRLRDKYSRIKSAIWDDEKMEVSEPVEEEIKDTANYCGMITSLRNGTWGK